MNIDFIKWMCEKADWKVDNSDDPIIKIPNGTESISWLVNSNILYPLLLQRAIEGVNYEHVYHISQMNDTIEIYKDNDQYDVLASFRFMSGAADKAKEQALKYIWEQEK
jgi:hypothetical protein